MKNSLHKTFGFVLLAALMSSCGLAKLANEEPPPELVRANYGKSADCAYATLTEEYGNRVTKTELPTLNKARVIFLVDALTVIDLEIMKLSENTSSLKWKTTSPIGHDPSVVLKHMPNIRKCAE
jgi:hypothetical protein